MAEWPKRGERGSTRWMRLWDAWKGLGAGILTFALSGLLGIILFYKSPVPTEIAFQNLLPAFIGLFALPWILENIFSGTEIPPQHIARSVDAPPGAIASGIFSGALGGLFAAFFPVVTGGVGGYLAGHATAQRDDRRLYYFAGRIQISLLRWCILVLFHARRPRCEGRDGRDGEYCLFTGRAADLLHCRRADCYLRHSFIFLAAAVPPARRCGSSLALIIGIYLLQLWSF